MLIIPSDFARSVMPRGAPASQFVQAASADSGAQVEQFRASRDGKSKIRPGGTPRVYPHLGRTAEAGIRLPHTFR